MKIAASHQPHGPLRGLVKPPAAPPAGPLATRPPVTAPSQAHDHRPTTRVPHHAGAAAMLLAAGLSCAGCAPAESAPPVVAQSTLAGFVIGDDITLPQALVTYADSIPVLATTSGLATLWTDATLRDPAATRRTIIGTYKGIESAELGLIVTGIILDRLAHVDGYSAQEKNAWATFVEEGIQLQLRHVSATLRAVFTAVKIDLGKPEIEVVTEAHGRPYACQSLPPPIAAHLERLQMDNLAAMTIYAEHVRWQLARGAGKTQEERALLITSLVGSRTIVRRDLSGLMDRYLSPSYATGIRKALTNPQAVKGLPGEFPGMLDIYRKVIRNGWTQFGDRFSLLTGLSGIGAMVGLLLAGSVMRRRRGRRETVRREGILKVVADERAKARQRPTVEEALVATDRAFEVLDQLVTPAPPDPFWSRTRFRSRGENLAWYGSFILLGACLGAAVEAGMAVHSDPPVPLLVPDLRPTPIHTVGIGQIETEDVTGYPAEVLELITSLSRTP